jgi:hypothetical protein
MDYYLYIKITKCSDFRRAGLEEFHCIAFPSQNKYGRLNKVENG